MIGGAPESAEARRRVSADEPHDLVSLERRNGSSRRSLNQRRVAPRGATVNGYGVLRSVFEAASARIGCSLTDLTSLSAQVDLQALRDLLFPKLRFEVVPVALTVDQVRELGFPSTPLKETEKRADRWRVALGVEQTEIDALATLQPNMLREIVERAFDPYFDHDLEERVTLAWVEWRRQAEEALHEQIDTEHLEALRSEAAGRLAELTDAIADINERFRLAAADHFRLPVIEVPQPEVHERASRLSLGIVRRQLGDGDPRSDPTEGICELNRARTMIEKLTLTCTEFRPIHRNTLHGFANMKNWRRDIAIMQQIAADREDCS